MEMLRLAGKGLPSSYFSKALEMFGWVASISARASSLETYFMSFTPFTVCSSATIFCTSV